MEWRLLHFITSYLSLQSSYLIIIFCKHLYHLLQFCVLFSFSSCFSFFSDFLNVQVMGIQNHLAQAPHAFKGLSGVTLYKSSALPDLELRLINTSWLFETAWNCSMWSCCEVDKWISDPVPIFGANGNEIQTVGCTEKLPALNPRTGCLCEETLSVQQTRL